MRLFYSYTRGKSTACDKKFMFLYNAISRYIERSNRTLQEEFLNTHLDLPAYDTEEFNSKLMENLISHNTKRVNW